MYIYKLPFLIIDIEKIIYERWQKELKTEIRYLRHFALTLTLLLKENEVKQEQILNFYDSIIKFSKLEKIQNHSKFKIDFLDLLDLLE